MTAAEATALAQAIQASKVLTPERLANWMDHIYKLIEAEALDGKFSVSLGDWLCGRHDIERDGHLPALLDALKANGFDVVMRSVDKRPLVTWFPKDEH